MVEIAIILVVNALFCAGLHIITRYEFELIDYSGTNNKQLLVRNFKSEGSMILGYLGFVIEDMFPAFMYKPLIECLTCMASFWGGLFYFGYWCALGCPERLVFAIGAIVYMIALAGLNTLIDRRLNEL